MGSFNGAAVFVLLLVSTVSGDHNNTECERSCARVLTQSRVHSSGSDAGGYNRSVVHGWCGCQGNASQCESCK